MAKPSGSNTIIAVVVALVILAAMMFLFVIRARDRAVADAQRDLAARAQLIAASLDHTLQIRLVETLTLAALPSLRGFAASDETARPSRTAIAQSELQSIVASDPAIRAALIVDASGRVILTTDGSMNADWSERLSVQEGMAGHLHASVPTRDSSEVSQYYSAPILDNFGNIAGVLVLRLTAQEIWDAVRAIENVLVVDEEGVRIADSTASSQIFSAIAPLPNDARALAKRRYGAEIAQIRVVPLPVLANQIKDNRASANFSDADGTAIHAAIRRLETNPWSVVVMAREDAVLASANAAFWEVFGSGAAMALMIVAIAYYARHNGAHRN